MLSDQTLAMISSTVVSLNEQVDSLDLPKMARRLAGDLRALILVYNTPQAVPPPLLAATLKQLQTRVKGEIAKLAASGELVGYFGHCCLLCCFINDS